MAIFRLRLRVEAAGAGRSENAETIHNEGYVMIAKYKIAALLIAVGIVFFAQTTRAADTGRLFQTPEEAAAALADAAKAKDIAAIEAIFGPSAKDLIESGDEAVRGQKLDEFNQAYAERHRIDKKDDKHMVLVVGSNDWPLSIPLAKQGNQWFFDTAAGREEILNRRIGENELTAVSVCRAYVEAQTEYAGIDTDGSRTAQFARKVVSTAGKKDGLFWPVKEGEKPSPLGPFIAQASSEGYVDNPDRLDPYHGYLFRIITAQGPAARGGKKSYIEKGKMTGGFALIAYPASWGKSGIMTFIVNQDADVYQKNLGPYTKRVAGGIVQYSPDKSWKLVEEDTSE